jgi:hypothetical protein
MSKEKAEFERLARAREAALIRKQKFENEYFLKTGKFLPKG